MQFIQKGRRESGSHNRIYLFLFLILLISISLFGCAKKTIVVPPVTPEPTTEKHVGKFVWYDLITHDLESASRFYENLFGWSFVNTSQGDSSVKTILRQGVPIGNAVQVKPSNKEINESRWVAYMSVENVDQAVMIIEQNKGTIYKKPKDLPNRGRIAIVLDPWSAVFGIVDTENGDPPDLETQQANNWIGSELWTTDVGGAVTFYTSLAGYELQLMDIGDGQKYHFLNTNDKPRAGIAKILWDDVKPNWIPYVSVESTMTIMQKASEFGSKVLIHPGDDNLENPVAIIADPSGAVFGVQQMKNFAKTGD